MTRKICIILCLGFTVFSMLASSAVGDEVHLTNGDRLTGEILRMENGSLILKTTYAGEVQLNWLDVVCLSSDRDLTFRLKDKEILIGRALCPANGTIQIVGAKVGESADLSLVELEAINPSPPPPAVTYKGNLIGGGSASSGNTDEAAAYLSAGFEARSTRHRFTLGGKYNYGETDGEITVRNAFGRIKYDLFLTEKVYAYAQGLLESDEFQDLNLRSTAGVGLGYQIFDTERTSLFVEGGVSYFNEDFDVAQDNSHASARESAGFTFGIVPERVLLFHLHEFYYSLEESNSYYLWSEQGLRFRLLGNFFANFEFDYSYNRQPAPGKKNADTALIASLGWGFAF